ncbi:unnamed protein product, partial [Gulo gulo]
SSQDGPVPGSEEASHGPGCSHHPDAGPHGLHPAAGHSLPSCSPLAEPSSSHQVSRKQGEGTSVISLQGFGTYLVSDVEPLSRVSSWLVVNLLPGTQACDLSRV